MEKDTWKYQPLINLQKQVAVAQRLFPTSAGVTCNFEPLKQEIKANVVALKWTTDKYREYVLEICVFVPHRQCLCFTMSNDTPSSEDKLKYDAAKKELLQALGKKRNLDKQLVCLFFARPAFVILTYHLSCVIGLTGGPNIQP